MPLSRRELKQRSSELNALMHDWDPIGVMRDPNWPRDEYEWLVGPLLTLLESGATEAEIGSRLRKEIVEYLGLSPEHYDFPAMGARVRVWFDRAGGTFCGLPSRFLLEKAATKQCALSSHSSDWRRILPSFTNHCDTHRRLRFLSYFLFMDVRRRGFLEFVQERFHSGVASHAFAQQNLLSCYFVSINFAIRTVIHPDHRTVE